MKIMWKPKSVKADDVIATVVNTAALSVAGVANGRTIPVIILQPDEENKIDAVINAHSGISGGNCKGVSNGNWNGSRCIKACLLSDFRGSPLDYWK